MCQAFWQHLLYKTTKPSAMYDFYYFLSCIISTLHKVLINAFCNEAFTLWRKAWNLNVPNEHHGLGCLTAREKRTQRWERGFKEKKPSSYFHVLFFFFKFSGAAMANLWQCLEHRPLLHQLQHHRYQKPHQCCGGVLGVSCTAEFLWTALL